MKWIIRLSAVLGLTLLLASCGSAASQTNSPPVIEEIITPTAAPAAQQIDLRSLVKQKDIPTWAPLCAQNDTGEPFPSGVEIEPYRGIALEFDPKSKEWISSDKFPTLVDTTGQPEYLFCLFRSWEFFANYHDAQGKNYPGYREDWYFTVQDLETKEVFISDLFRGFNPPDEISFPGLYGIQEVVGDWPSEEAKAYLASKQHKNSIDVRATAPYGFDSIDFAPDSGALYIPFEAGFRQVNLTSGSDDPIPFDPQPVACEKSSRRIRASLDGSLLVTSCYAFETTRWITEVFSAETFVRETGFETDFEISPQFEVLEQTRIMAKDKDTSGWSTFVKSLDVSTGEVQNEPLSLAGGPLQWISPEIHFAIAMDASNTKYQVWDLVERKVLNTFDPVGYPSYQVSRDGRLLIKSTQEGNVYIQVYDVESMRLLMNITADANATFHVSPDSRVMAVLTEYQVAFIDLENLSLVKIVPIENSGRYLLFSPDGARAVLPLGLLYSDSLLHSAVEVGVVSTGK